MKNILFVCHDYTLSGANLSLIDWVEKCNNKNYKFIFLIPRHNIDFEKKIKDIGGRCIVGYYTVPVKHIGKCNQTTLIKDWIKYIYDKTINELILDYLYFYFRKLDISIVHSNSFSVYFGALLANKLKCKHVWHIREFMEEDHQISHRDKKKIKKLCESSSAIFISDVIKEKYDIYNFKNKITIYNKIDFNKEYKKERKLFYNNKYNILIAGIISKNKGQKEAIDAINIINSRGYNVQLYICGTGEYEKKLKKYVYLNKIEGINFMGFQKNLNNIRKRMDIALMCSKKEALGRVTIEGMYYENLIIGANTGCTPIIIENGKTGLLYNQGDSIDLANKIIYAIENKEEMCDIIYNAKKEAIKKFSKNIDKKIIDYYDII